MEMLSVKDLTKIDLMSLEDDFDGEPVNTPDFTFGD